MQSLTNGQTPVDPDLLPEPSALADTWTEEDDRWYTDAVAARYGVPDPADLAPADPGQLMRSIAGYLTGLGVETEVGDGVIDFDFGGRTHRLTLEDLDERLDARLDALAAERGEDCGDWPRVKTAAERRADYEAAADWVATHSKG